MPARITPTRFIYLQVIHNTDARRRHPSCKVGSFGFSAKGRKEGKEAFRIVPSYLLFYWPWAFSGSEVHYL